MSQLSVADAQVLKDVLEKELIDLCLLTKMHSKFRVLVVATPSAHKTNSRLAAVPLAVADNISVTIGFKGKLPYTHEHVIWQKALPQELTYLQRTLLIQQVANLATKIHPNVEVLEG